MSKTQEAIKLVEEGMTQYQAAKEKKINRATLSRAWKIHIEKKSLELEPCPCCGTKVAKDQIDWMVLK